MWSLFHDLASFMPEVAAGLKHFRPLLDNSYRLDDEQLAPIGADLQLVEGYAVWRAFAVGGDLPNADWSQHRKRVAANEAENQLELFEDPFIATEDELKLLQHLDATREYFLPKNAHRDLGMSEDHLRKIAEGLPTCRSRSFRGPSMRTGTGLGKACGSRTAAASWSDTIRSDGE